MKAANAQAEFIMYRYNSGELKLTPGFILVYTVYTITTAITNTYMCKYKYINLFTPSIREKEQQ